MLKETTENRCSMVKCTFAKRIEILVCVVKIYLIILEGLKIVRNRRNESITIHILEGQKIIFKDFDTFFFRYFIIFNN